MSFQRKFLCEYFWLNLKNKPLPFSKSVPSNFSICEVSCKNKRYLHSQQKMFIWIFPGWNSKKPLSYLKLTPSNLINCKVCCKIKILKIGNKNAWFVYFWAVMWKYYCHIWNPRIWLVGKFSAKKKKKKKNNLNLGPKMSNLGIFGLEF